MDWLDLGFRIEPLRGSGSRRFSDSRISSGAIGIPSLRDGPGGPLFRKLVFRFFQLRKRLASTLIATWYWLGAIKVPSLGGHKRSPRRLRFQGGVCIFGNCQFPRSRWTSCPSELRMRRGKAGWCWATNQSIRKINGLAGPLWQCK